MFRITGLTAVWWAVIGAGFLIGVGAGAVSLDAATMAIIALCFFCELMDSSLGMGYGTTLTPVLLLGGYEPHQLVPCILVSELLSGFSAAFFHARAGNIRFRKGSAHLRAAMILSIWSVVGVAVGVELALSVSRVALTGLIGTIIVVAGLSILIASGRTYSYRSWKISLLAMTASFNKALSGGGYGPLMTGGQVLSGIQSRAAVGITSFAEGFTCLAASTLYLLRGESLDLEILFTVVTGALSSVPLSAQIVKYTHEDVMKKVIGWMTLILGTLLMMRSGLFG